MCVCVCVCVFVCVFWYACPVEKVQSCNSVAIWEHTYHKTCHTSVRIPLTSLVPADFLCGAVRGQQRHTHLYTFAQSHTHTYASAHPQSWTNLHSHFVETGTPCNLGFKPQKPRYIHLRHSVRSYFKQNRNACVCRCVLVAVAKKKKRVW